MPCQKLFYYFTLSIAFFLFLTDSTDAQSGKKENFQALTYQNCSITMLENRAYYFALKEAIGRAKKEITLSYFRFKTKGRVANYPDVVMEALISAANRGVTVVLLLDQNKDINDITSKENRETMERLHKTGVKVYLDAPETTTHTKMTVIDGRYTFIGSHNLTQSALKYNNEISLMIESPQVAAEALSYIKSLIPTKAYR